MANDGDSTTNDGLREWRRFSDRITRCNGSVQLTERVVYASRTTNTFSTLSLCSATSAPCGANKQSSARTIQAHTAL